MQHSYTSTSVNMGIANAARERDPNCIEMHLKNIEAELAESFNSAENLADKLKGEPRPKSPDGNVPVPMDVATRLVAILDSVRYVNTQLSRAHSAISG